MNTKLPYYLGLLLCLLSTAAIAQQPTLEWAKRYSGIAGRHDNAVAIAVDSDGNSYVTGETRVDELADISTTIKYSPSGEQLWAVKFGDYSEVSAIAVDNRGGVYVTGNVFDGRYGDFLTVRYDASTGRQTWVSRYEEQNNGYNQATAIAVDNQGGVYITGNSQTSYPDSSSYTVRYDYLTLRYDALTGQQTWVKRYDGPTRGSDYASAIAVDTQGSVYVTGYSVGISSGYDYATLRYDAATGHQVWVSRYAAQNNSHNQAPALAVDSKGGVYVTGSSGEDFATLRYDAATGNQAWISRYNGPADSLDRAKTIAVDNMGGVYVAGTSVGSTSGNDFATLRYDAVTGRETWVSRFSNGEASALVVDNQGGVYVTGRSDGDFATLRYEAATGNQAWIRRYNGPAGGSDYATAIAVDYKGGVYITGNSDSRTDSDFATLRYDAATGEQSWVRLYKSTINTYDRPVSVAVDDAGNSYVTGTMSGNLYIGEQWAVTVKYSPSGEQLWAVRTEGISQAAAIVIDDHGGVYITGSSSKNPWVETDYITLRYAAATGEQTWESRFRGGEANDLAIDNKGGVYVTGTSYNDEGDSDYVTLRYDAATGNQTWVNYYNGPAGGRDQGKVIAVDTQGGVYVSGNSESRSSAYESQFATIRYDAATGRQTWAMSYKPGNYSGNHVTGIAVDNAGGVYVAGNTGGADETLSEVLSNFITIRYEAATGKESWATSYNGPVRSYDISTGIAVDNQGGVYVTGFSGNIEYEGPGTPVSTDYATVRYDAATGKQSWVRRYNGSSNNDLPVNIARAIAVDYAGGVYVTGSSQVGENGIVFSTVKYNTTDGTPLWAQQTTGPNDGAVDLALDREGNVIVTGYSRGTDTGYDFLTIKYSQEGVCPPLMQKALAASLTAKAGSTASYALAPGSGATRYEWSITGSDGEAFTGFTGQGSDTLSVTWPRTPDVYRISLTYSAGEGCPSKTSIAHVHVFDPEAGFVTGAGWHEITVNPELELMQQPARVQWELNAKYKKEEQVQGQLQLRLQGTGWAFESTSLQARTLVITGNRAYFRGGGQLSYKDKSGKIRIDARQFGFLVSASDGQLDKGTEADRLRVKVWVLNPDGSRGAEVLDTQLACPGASQHYNAPPCQVIEKGNIVIHKPGIKALAQQALAAEAEGLQVYPTATSDRATVHFTLEQESTYTLELFDVKGALVQRFASGSAQAGRSYEQELRAEELARGLYLVRLTSGTQVQTAKLVVQK